jgi:hypothetical protein
MRASVPATTAAETERPKPEAASWPQAAIEKTTGSALNQIRLMTMLFGRDPRDLKFAAGIADAHRMRKTGLACSKKRAPHQIDRLRRRE